MATVPLAASVVGFETRTPSGKHDGQEIFLLFAFPC